MLALRSGYSADNVAAALDAWVATMPTNELISLTWDRGSEMARWENLWARWDIDIYFCDPHAPWQSGANEQTNGLLRWWLPKTRQLHSETPAQRACTTGRCRRGDPVPGAAIAGVGCFRFRTVSMARASAGIGVVGVGAVSDSDDPHGLVIA